MKRHEEKFLKEMTRVTVARDERINELLKGYKISGHEFVLSEIIIAMNSYKAFVTGIEQDYLQDCIYNLKETL